MLEEGVEEMVGKLKVKLLAKQKELRKANGKLATQAKFMTARAELSKTQSGIKSYFPSLETIREDPAVDEDGEVQGAGIEGYEVLSDKTLKSHTTKMLSKLVELTKQNPVMQIQLYKTMERYILGTKTCNDRDVAELIVQGLQDHVAYFKSKHGGRYPNEVRAALQAVYVAVSTSMPPNRAASFARVLGVPVEHLIIGKARGEDYRAGTVNTLVDRRGKERSDKLCEAWMEHAHEVWLQVSRISPKAEDVVRNPTKDKDDETPYVVPV